MSSARSREYNSPRTIRKSSDSLSWKVRTIFAAAEGPWKTLYWVIIETGLRIGEVLALRFKNLEGQILKVESSAWEGKTTEPKTKAGYDAFRFPIRSLHTSRL